ncbi:hypothetical protein B0H10DRAFT_1841336, partial [Mycena sp. CBHHK59/15]
LHLFRKERTIELLGRASFRNHGAGVIMSDEVLHRIVDCAHFSKIQTMADLLKDTHWHRATEDGAKVLALISQHRPILLPPPPSIPITTPSAQQHLQITLLRQPRKIGSAVNVASSVILVCYTHFFNVGIGTDRISASNRKCSMYTARTPRARGTGTENDPPTPATPAPAPPTPAAPAALPFSPSAMAVPP